MIARFDAEKAIQAAGVLLRHEFLHRMTRLRLLKLLYIVDRQSWQERGKPLLRATVFALDHGPIHSEVYDLIKGVHIDEPRWSQYFRSERRDLVMYQEPEVDLLSTFEIEKLIQISDQFADLSDWDISKSTHNFEEFRECYQEGTSTRIPLEIILKHTGRLDDIDSVYDELNASDEFDEALKQVQSHESG